MAGYGRIRARATFSSSGSRLSAEADTRRLQHTSTPTWAFDSTVSIPANGTVVIYDHSTEAWTASSCVFVDMSPATANVSLTVELAGGLSQTFELAPDGVFCLSAALLAGADITLTATSAQTVKCFLLGDAA